MIAYLARAKKDSGVLILLLPSTVAGRQSKLMFRKQNRKTWSLFTSRDLGYRIVFSKITVVRDLHLVLPSSLYVLNDYMSCILICVVSE